MATGDYKRKLTAILHADVTGYSRLMGDDEEATLRTLTAYRDAISASIKQYSGRVIDTTGDSVLAEFSSVVDAVKSAVAIQNDLKIRNAALSESRRLEFRIGVNLGDVIEEGDTIYGDGVNTAQRVGDLAEPGGICITEPVYRQVRNKLSFRYEYLGEQTVKNIAEPVQMYRVLREIEERTSLEEGKEGTKPGTWKRGALPITGIIALIAVALAVVSFQREPSSPQSDAVPVPKDAPSVRESPPALSEKPSIAVLDKVTNYTL